MDMNEGPIQDRIVTYLRRQQYLTSGVSSIEKEFSLTPKQTYDTLESMESLGTIQMQGGKVVLLEQPRNMENGY